MMIVKFILPIIALSIVIAIHELGHLMMAKLFKINVEVYSIGMGKKIFSKKIAGTEYALSLIPLGGYCKLKGGDLQKPNTDKDSLDNLHPLKRVLIFFSGPLFNLILTFLLFTTIFSLPVHQLLPTTIMPVLGKDLPAEVAGILKGDEIISINGKKISSFSEISNNIKDDKLDILIKRSNNLIELEIYPKIVDNSYFIGVYPYIPLLVKGDNMGKLEKGDIIELVDDTRIDNYLDLIKFIENKELVDITYDRNNQLQSVSYSINELHNISFTNTYSNNLLVSLSKGIKQTKDMFYNIITMFLKLFKTGEVTKSISSPLRLVYEMGNSIDGIYKNNSLLITIQSFLTIMATISLTLGFINLLPIPILDGGQILLNFIIAIKRSNISRSFINAYQTLGLIIVLLLFTLGISNDIFFFGDL